MNLTSVRAQLWIFADLGLSGLIYISALGRLLADLVWPWLGRLEQLCAAPFVSPSSRLAQAYPQEYHGRARAEEETDKVFEDLAFE